MTYSLLKITSFHFQIHYFKIYANQFLNLFYLKFHLVLMDMDLYLMDIFNYKDLINKIYFCHLRHIDVVFPAAHGHGHI